MNLKHTNWIGTFVILLLLMTGVSFANRGYDLDEFDDLELESLDKQRKKTNNRTKDGQRLILFDDNLYLLDDDFDFGQDELELQKLELNPDDMETAKEYENFLNAFFGHSTPIGSNIQDQGRTPSPKYTPPKANKGKKKTKPKTSTSPRTPRSSEPPTTLRPSGNEFGYGVSAILGVTVPIGENLSNFGTGSNYGIRLDTPVSFSLAGMEAVIGTELYFSTMSAKTGPYPYKITNIVGNVSIIPTSSIEIRTGLGLSPLSIGDLSTIALSIPVDLNYYLPMNFSGFKIAFNLHAQMTLGYPNDGTSEGGSSASSEFINVGLFIKTPFGF